MRYGKLSFMLAIACVLMFVVDVFGQGCGGMASTRRTPVRNLLSAQPVRTVTKNILTKISTPPSARQSCGSSVQSSCAGSVQHVHVHSSCAGSSQSCAGSLVAPQAPAPVALQASCNCGCESGLPCTCSSQETAACSLAESHIHLVSVVPRQSVRNVVATTGDYARALASATVRAAQGIKGHVSGELVSGRASSSGVGYASNNSNPRTCLGVPGQTNATCAVVRGADGWYSTCVK